MLIQTRNVGFKRDILIQTTCQAKIERPISISTFEIRKVIALLKTNFGRGGGVTFSKLCAFNKGRSSLQVANTRTCCIDSES